MSEAWKLAFGLMFIAFLLCLTQLYAQAILIDHLSFRVAGLEVRVSNDETREADWHRESREWLRECSTLQARTDTRMDEFQVWRLHLTAASRMGWSRASRFLRAFPLEDYYDLADDEAEP